MIGSLTEIKDVLMEDQTISPEDIESCREIIFEFLPPPVTEHQRETLEKCRAIDLTEARAESIQGGDYERCLCTLLNTKKDEFSPLECLNSAAEVAIKFAGAADGSELYAKLSEVLPEQFFSDK
ncbi:MAG: hypothetical protein WA901_09755 [Phormidesmis sp.]